MMIEKLTHMLTMKSNDPYLGVLIISSLLRDDIPWLYELGKEAYRASKGTRKGVAKEALMNFKFAVEFTFDGPLGEELMMRSKEGHFILREVERWIDRIISIGEEQMEESR